MTAEKKYTIVHLHSSLHSSELETSTAAYVWRKYDTPRRTNIHVLRFVIPATPRILWLPKIGRRRHTFLHLQMSQNWRPMRTGLTSTTVRVLCVYDLRVEEFEAHHLSGVWANPSNIRFRKSSPPCTSRNRCNVSMLPTVLRTAGVTPKPSSSGFSSTPRAFAEAYHHVG